MKKKIIIIAPLVILLASLLFIGKSQTGNIDELDFMDFDINTSGQYQWDNSMKLSETSFLQKFNLPWSFNQEFSEPDEATLNHYFYNGTEAWFMNGQLQAFSSSYGFSLHLANGGSIGIGDDISAVYTRWSSSWASKPSANQVFVTLHDQFDVVDMHIIFEFDPVSRTITNISVQ